MKRLKKITRGVVIVITVLTAGTKFSYCQDLQTSSPATEDSRINYFGTSVFVLTSLIPNDNTCFLEIDYGRKLNVKSDLILGLNIYKYEAPMSIGWTDETKYPGHVFSYGAVFGYQYYLHKGLYLEQIANPLFLDYHEESASEKTGTGFMMLCATRIGYHFDFSLFKSPLFLEVGGEISYWPINSNVPPSFKDIDKKFNRYVFSPALQIGYRF